MNYFISDLHLGHSNIIGLCKRPFKDVYEMDSILINSWNARVSQSDHVFILGDIAFRSECSVEDYLRKLKGKKYLIVGNHDNRWMQNLDLSEWFESVDYLLEMRDGKHRLVLCHYPMMTWNGNTSFLIYGHIHNNKPKSYWPVLQTYERALNACVEVNNYMPVSFEELVANNKKWRAK